MKNISIIQIIVLIFLSVLIFSDFSKLKIKILKEFKNLTVKNRKKGI